MNEKNEPVSKGNTKKTETVSKQPTKKPRPSNRRLISPKKRIQVAALLAMGCSRRDVAAIMGISHSVIQVEMGKDDKFSKMVEKAETECKLKTIKRILNDPSWQSSAWWLERRYQKEYGRNQIDVEKTAEVADMLLNLLETKNIIDDKKA